MKKTLWLDYETRSVVNLEEAGVHNYASSTSTKVLLIAYALDNSEVTVLEHIKSPLIPQELQDAWYDPDTEIVCWNTTFERLISRYCLWLKIPIERFLDAMIISRHCSLPAKLEKCCAVLKLGADSKIDGDKLKALFCYPQHLGGEITLFGVSEPRFADWNSNPVEWDQFKQYVKYDVISMRKICKLLKNHPLPQSEIEGFWLDQKINDHGVPVDLDLIQKMDKIATKAKDIANKKIIELTGVENPNSRPQLLTWLKKEGYGFNSLRKPVVAESLDDIGLSAKAAEALELRRESSKTSDAKLDNIKYAVSADGFLRDQFAFLGASRTGRFSGHGVQWQNLPRPSKEVEQKLDLAVELIQKEDYEGLKSNFSSVMDAVVGSIRSCFKAPEGKQFVICDLAAIEHRVVGWLSGCDSILEIHRQGRDPYLAFAEVLFGIPYEQMIYIGKNGEHKCKPEYKELRQLAKAPVLACGFGLAGGEEIQNKDFEVIRTGLWGYAKYVCDVDMPQDLAHKAVGIYRKMYKPVEDFWYNLEEAAITSIRHKKEIKIQKVVLDVLGKTFRIKLPSGRYLHYINPRIEVQEFRGKPKDTIVFEGMKKSWITQTTYGGRLTENCVQAIARDILMEGLKNADKAGLNICAHVHDEIVCLEKDDKVSVLRECMMRPISWAQNLPLGAEGFVSNRYKKG